MNKAKKIQITEVVTAMMHASGLCPQIGDNYYENLNGTTIGMFLQGLCVHYELNASSWPFHFNNIEWMDTPQETIDHIIDNLNSWIEQSQED